MYQQTYDILKKCGLDDSDIDMLKSGEVDWDIHENDLILTHREGGNRALRLQEAMIDELFNVYRFESRDMPRAGNSEIFKDGHLDDWAGVSRDTDWEALAKGYAKAADKLHKSIENDEIEPYLFLCRHTLELTLKGIIMLGQESLRLTDDLPDHHELARLWTTAYPILQLKGRLESEKISKIRTLLYEYHDADPNSFNFRYPVSKKNKIILHDTKLKRFSKKNHHEFFTECIADLYNVVKSLKTSIMFSKAWASYRSNASQKEV